MNEFTVDPCPSCKPNTVCRTPSCGRLKGKRQEPVIQDKQAEPVAQPYAYVYEFDSRMFGIHRSFSSNERNGSKPSRVVPVYTHPAPAVDLTHMVNRFLGWKLPMDFAPDCGISIDTEIAGRNGWPSGTNLLNAEQAKQMFEYVTQVTPAVAPQHPDDEAVDKFAAAMKQKLAQAREKGRSGWEQMNPAGLSSMLREHVEKGDPRDVANFCMFLWNLGQPIAQCHKAPAVAVNDHVNETPKIEHDSDDVLTKAGNVNHIGDSNKMVRLTDEFLIETYLLCKAEWKATNKRQRERIAIMFGNALQDAMIKKNGG